MTRSLRFLDAYCCAGGASKGLKLAYPEAEITGVDIRPQPRYPYRFVLGDAVEHIREHGKEYDFIWASPPCQEHTSLKSISAITRLGDVPLWHRDRLSETREALVATGVPYIIENVVGAPLFTVVELCGAMFGLRVYRHRRFEAPFLIFSPAHPKHTLPAFAHRNPTNGLSRKESYMAGLSFASQTGNAGAYAGPGMGIDWMTGAELSQSIPPAYSEWLAQFIPLDSTALRAA